MKDQRSGAFESRKADRSEFTPVQVQFNMIRNLMISGALIVLINVAMVCAHKKYKSESDKNEIQMEVNQAVS